MSSTAKRLVYSKYGKPLEVLQLVEEAASTEIKEGEALVRVLYTPINPSDIMCVEGVYPVKPPLPATTGREGVGEVIKGSTLKPGDRVLLRKSDFGNWRTQMVVEEKFLVKVSNDLPLEAAATLIVNPCTAYL